MPQLTKHRCPAGLVGGRLASKQRTGPPWSPWLCPVDGLGLWSKGGLHCRWILFRAVTASQALCWKERQVSILQPSNQVLRQGPELTFILGGGDTVLGAGDREWSQGFLREEWSKDLYWEREPSPQG